jgi:Fe-S-cluster containining protein
MLSLYSYEGTATPAYNRASPFSYQCQGCGRCCHHKRIPLNPFEVARLARNRNLAPGEFVRHYVRESGPWLRNKPDGACVFLENGGCSVHADRPLACRLWPLARRVEADGSEHFPELLPQSGSKGIWGTQGSVAAYLEKQGAAPYIAAADRHQPMLEALLHTPHGNAHGDDGQPAFRAWLAGDSLTPGQETDPTGRS